jgi:hypothetical protein
LGAFGEGRGWGGLGAGFGPWALEKNAWVANAAASTATAIVILGRESDMDTSISGFAVGVAPKFIPTLRKKLTLFFLRERRRSTESVRPR